MQPILGCLMGWRSWFGATTERKPSAGWNFVVDTVMQPLNALSTDIAMISCEYSEKIKPHFRSNGLKHPENQIVYINFTFMAFLMRVIALVAFSTGLDRDAFLRLRDTLLAMMVPPQITVFFGEPPDRSKLESMLRNTLEEAENRDAKAGEDFADALKRISFDTVRDILVLAGYQIGPDRKKEESAAIEEVIANCLNEILTPERLATYADLLRHGVAAIESCRRQGVSIPAMMKEIVASMPRRAASHTTA
jgi:hypothetical protein